MAEFLWTFAVQEVLKKTVKLAAEQIGQAWGFEEELSKLRDSLLMAQAILGDVDKIKPDLESPKLWVKKLEDIVLEADALLDDLAYEDVRHKVETDEGVCNFISSSKNFLLFPLKMAEITAVAKKLDEHYSKHFVGFVASTSKEAEIDLSEIVETDSFLDEIRVIGRETEVLEIVNDLHALRSQETLVVLPIVGPGGLGKTTLVKEVFNHKMVRKNFDTYIWVCVSDPFDIKKILRAILETLDPKCGGLDRKQVILQELQKRLSDKKYFLVLDDVWNENLRLWNELRGCLLKINQNFGNVVIVTTRSDEVAKIMETHCRYHLSLLRDDYCWSLFEKCAFGSELPIISDVIREQLVKKFGGIPLVVKVLGGMVKSCKNDEELQSTLENLRRITLQDENHILSTIKLSVDRLPSSSLKQCFAYCSNFPPDFCFYKEALVQMWIAQGFIHLPHGRNVMMEDIGAKNFDILLSRSLFQDVVRDERGRIEYCKMHDLIHEVSCTISNDQNWRWDLVMDEKSQGDEVLLTSPRIRTLYCSENVFDNHNKITNFIFLRVLVIHSMFPSNLLDSIVKLKHLRYLDILESSIGRLPESIVLLYHLQTLRLGGLLELPTELRKLVNLRHLEFDCHRSIAKMPKHLSRMTQLQTLSSFVVGFDEGYKIEELGHLKYLKGKLRLLRLERVKSKEEAMTANLAEKENIYDLSFEWSDRPERKTWNDNHLNVLEGLQPYKNLQVLSIQDYGGELLPRGTFVENLIELYLFRCERCETLPMLGQLSKLEVLTIAKLSTIKSIGDEFYGNYSDDRTLFPKLKDFKICNMDSLEQWEEIDALLNCTSFPHLERLSIYSCSKLTNIPNIFATHSQKLEVDTVNAKLFPSFQGPPKLRSLRISECKSLTKLPNWLEYCSSLENLLIGSFSDDIFPPNLQNSQKLSSLIIENFQKLPEGLAYNLKTLQVFGPMQGYDWSPLIHANSLEDLKLFERGTCVTELPRQFEHLTALKLLRIDHFNGIESLPEWFKKFSSLETLELYFCKNLKNLPSKEAMSNLTRLNHLSICECDQLQLGDKDGFEWVKVYVNGFNFSPKTVILH